MDLQRSIVTSSVSSLENPALWMSCLIVFKCEDATPVKVPHVGLHQQVPWHGEFKRFFHQKFQKVCKPLLLWPEQNYKDHGEFLRDHYSRQDMFYKSKWKEGINA